MSPDLGQYLWRHVPGARARTVAVVPVYVRSVAEAPGGTVDVSFAYYPDDDDEGLPIGFMGTLNTRQPVDELLEMIRPDRPMAIVGMLARGTVTGSGCATGTRECYRLILGRLESPPADPVKRAGAACWPLRHRAEIVERCVAENMVDHRARRPAAMEARRQRRRRH